MDQGLIPKRYAKALYMVAAEHGEQQAVYEKMVQLQKAFEDQPQLGTAVRNPFVSPADKASLILAACGSDLPSGRLADFIRLLEQNGRVDTIRQIATAYQAIYRKANRIYRVEVTAAAPMDDAEQDRLKRLILKHLDGGKMEYSFRVDPALIGGFTVSIENERLDASVANELKQLRLKLLSNK